MSSFANEPRWERDFVVQRGVWKQQLPIKHLKLAARGDIEGLQSLLSEHPDWLNKRANHNRTFLWEATRAGKLAMVQWLIEQGAELGATGCYNSESYVQITPYCAAIYYQRPALVEYFRTLGAHEQQDIFRAAFLGELPQVAHYLDENPTLLNAEDPHDSVYYVPLIAFGVAGGQLAVVEYLLAQRANVHPYSAQLIYLAAHVGRLDILTRLIMAGVEITATPPSAYVAGRDLELLRYLLEQGSSPNASDKNGITPLLYLVRGDKGEQPAKVQLLLEHGADVHLTNSMGQTALHLAAQAGYTQSVMILLAHDADPTRRDAVGATPLDLAMLRNKTAVASLLSV